jgi:hypothetical protein
LCIYILVYLDYLLYYAIFPTIDIYHLWCIFACLHDKFYFALWWRSKNLSLISINDTLNRLIIPITSIISPRRNCIRLLISSLLSSSSRLYPIQVLLIKSPILPDAMLPFLRLLVSKVVFKKILPWYHFALLPLRLIVTTLNYDYHTLGYNNFPYPWNWPFTNCPS